MTNEQFKAKLSKLAKWIIYSVIVGLFVVLLGTSSLFHTVKDDGYYSLCYNNSEKDCAIVLSLSFN